MESINSFKGYGKVNEAEDREFRRKTRRRLIFIIVALVLLLVIVVGVTVAAVVARHSNGGSSSAPSSSDMPTATSIKALCSVTRYPDSCFSSISSANGTADPEELFKLSIRVAMDATSKVLSLTDAFTIPNNDPRLNTTIQICKEMFADTVDQLNSSLASLMPAPGEKLLTAAKIDDLKTWLSAAITNQETCLDSFEGTLGDFRQQMEATMLNSTQLTSNSLAIVTRILSIMDNLNLPVHRKLLSTTATNSGLPSWMSNLHRRAMLQDKGQLNPNVTVAKDGTGQVKTISEAVQMIPKKSPHPFVIYVKEGVYVENVVLDKNKWNVIIYGDGMTETVISGSKNFIDGTPTFATATFVAAGRRFMARDMGFKNSAGPQKHQAVALRAASDRSVFYRCSFDAFQDTLYTHSLRQFYHECDITGTIDFIFGDASVVFQKCTIRPRQPLPNQENTITAQGRSDPNENTGISIQGCTISAFDALTRPTYLGRPWKNFSTTIIMQTEIGSFIEAAGWLPWVSGTAPPDTITYAEYQNTGIGSKVDGRVKWPGYQATVTKNVAEKYTVGKFLKGDEWIPETGVAYAAGLL